MPKHVTPLNVVTPSVHFAQKAKKLDLQMRVALTRLRNRLDHEVPFPLRPTSNPDQWNLIVREPLDNEAWDLAVEVRVTLEVNAPPRIDLVNVGIQPLPHGGWNL